ncbi:hypothetical protein NBT05_07630 [Aquimarina sp. ERC-38]|uniref:hypothetical protein n=1 Tax=Aquimarina sp. ERC-38 TaxID=2949996 RepID=UPI00224701E2|nr:hypothetical protein [Aquimarina sp. ERC-38]UZO82336.1 hypothetical protein NBT05_07630 [Aquimarina sp. ERC-38]
MSDFQLPILLQLVITSGYAIYFEIILPPLHERYTGDFWDVICYFTGWLFFYMMNFKRDVVSDMKSN